MYNLFDIDLNLDLYREQYKNIFINERCFIDFADKLENELGKENNNFKLYLKDKTRFSCFF